MASEVIPFPAAENYPDTPESLQECVYFAAAIDAQLEDWVEMKDSHHPSMYHRTLTSIIESKCLQPPIDDSQDAQKADRTPEEALLHQEQQARHAVIYKVANNRALDAHEIENDIYREYFEYLDDFFLKPNNPQRTGVAITHLRRIFTMRELLAMRFTRLEENFAVEHFELIVQRILSEI